jgi:hypothetical protein
MFQPGSRYEEVETATIEVAMPDGSTRTVAYKRRRFIPPAEGLTALVEHTVAAGERLDLIAATYLGDPAEFWRLCDANGVMRPAELEETGRTIVIALPLP